MYTFNGLPDQGNVPSGGHHFHRRETSNESAPNQLDHAFYRLCVKLFDVRDLSRAFSSMPNNLLGCESEERICGVDFDTSSDSHRFQIDYLRREWLSKSEFLVVKGVDKRAAAVKRFDVSERRCFHTNTRLRHFNPFRHGRLNSIFHAARVKIERCLGDLDLDEVLLHGNYSGGATSGSPKRLSQIYNKVSGQPEITADCLSLGVSALRRHPGLLRNWMCYPRTYSSNGVAPTGERVFVLRPEDLFKIVPGNKLDYVPKNYKSDRTIAKEPSMNMFIQKGFGSVIRKRLKRKGINLNDQSTNQFLAGLGSVTGSLATIDLSMASDCVSVELVRFLLPRDWFDGLDACRSKSGVDESGRIVTYQKFSSMGNGFTFELESLIFWAIVSSVCDIRYTGIGRESISVYGDDIICPSAAARDVLRVLAVCGFEANLDKTFYEGPFRESCGKHYHNGHDVTPFYWKKSINDLHSLVVLHNRVRDCVLRLNNEATTRKFERLQRLFFRRFGLARVFSGSSALGDVVFHSYDSGSVRIPRETLMLSKGPASRRIDGRTGLRAWLFKAHIRQIAEERSCETARGRALVNLPVFGDSEPLIESVQPDESDNVRAVLSVMYV